jgi:hypothetical protein
MQAISCSSTYVASRPAASLAARGRVAAAAPLSRAARLSSAPVRSARLVTRAGAVQKVTKDELELAMQVRLSSVVSWRSVWSIVVFSEAIYFLFFSPLIRPHPPPPTAPTTRPETWRTQPRRKGPPSSPFTSPLPARAAGGSSPHRPETHLPKNTKPNNINTLSLKPQLRY